MRTQGTVTNAGAISRLRTKEITVEVPADVHIREDDKVEIRVIMTDEELGAAFRALFDRDSEITDESLRNLCDDVENSAGWPALADLIRTAAGI